MKKVAARRHLLNAAEPITLINQRGTPLELNGLVFNALDGAMPARFQATNWRGALDAGYCTQCGQCAALLDRPEQRHTL